MASITNNTNNVNNNSTSPNRKYIDLLNNWAVKKKEELEHYNTVKNEYVGKTTNELWMVLKGAQETRVLAYQALDSFWKEFLKTKDFQTFQYYCELSMKAFNDINLDIRNLQKMDNFHLSKHSDYKVGLKYLAFDVCKSKNHQLMRCVPKLFVFLLTMQKLSFLQI